MLPRYTNFPSRQMPDDNANRAMLRYQSRQNIVALIRRLEMADKGEAILHIMLQWPPASRHYGQATEDMSLTLQR